jgi:hypothetical protein
LRSAISKTLGFAVKKATGRVNDALLRSSAHCGVAQGSSLNRDDVDLVAADERADDTQVVVEHGDVGRMTDRDSPEIGSADQQRRRA